MTEFEKLLFLLHVVCCCHSVCVIWSPAHKGGVRGVAFDAYNQILISAGVNCDLRFWRFGSRDKARVMLKELTMSASIARIMLHRERYGSEGCVCGEGLGVGRGEWLLLAMGRMEITGLHSVYLEKQGDRTLKTIKISPMEIG